MNTNENVGITFLLIIILLLFITFIFLLIFSLINFDSKTNDFIEIDDEFSINQEIESLEKQCGSDCTADLKCRSFMFDPINKTCTLYPKLTQNAYSKVVCNKIQPITDFDTLNDGTLTRNSVYTCHNSIQPTDNNDINRIQYVNNNKNILTTNHTSNNRIYPSPKITRYQFRNL
jgi:hypothetical protein